MAIRWPWTPKKITPPTDVLPTPQPVYRSYPGNRTSILAFDGVPSPDPGREMLQVDNNPRISLAGIVPDPEPNFWFKRQNTIMDWEWFGGRDLAPHALRQIVAVPPRYMPVPQEDYQILGEGYANSAYVFIDPATGAPITA